MSAQVEALIRAERSDRAIARETGVGRAAVARIRAHMGVPPRPRRPFGSPGTRTPRADGPLEHAMAANYAAGMDDYRSAERLGVERWRVQYWRRRRGLPAHGAMRREATLPSWRDPLWAACRRAIGNRIADDVADEAVSDMVVAVLEGRVERADIEREARTYRNRALRTWANRHAPASLDEDREGDGLRGYATIACPSAVEPFRLIELAHLARLSGLDVAGLLS